MAKAPDNKGGNKPQGGAPGWAWLVTGLLVGLFVAFLVYLQGQREIEQAEGAHTAERAAGQDARSVRKEERKEVPPPSRPKFDFYTILPEMEIPVREDDGAADETGRDKPAEPDSGQPRELEEGATYVMQVGSFRKFEEADRYKAELALMGIESHIQTVSINGEDWHRVRIGPIASRDDLAATRGKLREHEIEGLLLKLKE